jgi:hypothetical protein
VWTISLLILNLLNNNCIIFDCISAISNFVITSKLCNLLDFASATILLTSSFKLSFDFVMFSLANSFSNNSSCLLISVIFDFIFSLMFL